MSRFAVSPEVLGELRSLGEGWDSYGGHPPAEPALDAARAMRVVATPAGGIQFEWVANGWTVELEVHPDGSPTFFAYQQGGPTLEAAYANPEATLYEGTWGQLRDVSMFRSDVHPNTEVLVVRTPPKDEA